MQQILRDANPEAYSQLSCVEERVELPVQSREKRQLEFFFGTIQIGRPEGGGGRSAEPSSWAKIACFRVPNIKDRPVVPLAAQPGSGQELACREIAQSTSVRVAEEKLQPNSSNFI